MFKGQHHESRKSLSLLLTLEHAYCKKSQLLRGMFCFTQVQGPNALTTLLHLADEFISIFAQFQLPRYSFWQKFVSKILVFLKKNLFYSLYFVNLCRLYLPTVIWPPSKGLIAPTRSGFLIILYLYIMHTTVFVFNSSVGHIETPGKLTAPVHSFYPYFTSISCTPQYLSFYLISRTCSPSTHSTLLHLFYQQVGYMSWEKRWTIQL